MGFVFQAFHLLPHLTVARNVALPLALNGIRRDAARRVGEVLPGRRARRPRRQLAARVVGRRDAARGARTRIGASARARAGRRADRQPRSRQRRRPCSSCCARNSSAIGRRVCWSRTRRPQRPRPTASTSSRVTGSRCEHDSRRRSDSGVPPVARTVAAVRCSGDRTAAARAGPHPRRDSRHRARRRAGLRGVPDQSCRGR